MASATALSDALTELLGAAVAVLGASAPDRRFVSASRPAMDCPMLTTYCAGIGVAQSSTHTPSARSEGRRRTIVYQASLAVVITRCSPLPSEAGTPPSTAAISAFAAALLDDVYELVSGLRHRMAAGTLFAGVRYKAIGDAQPIDESGGQAGWLIPITIDLDGINV